MALASLRFNRLSSRVQWISFSTRGEDRLTLKHSRRTKSSSDATSTSPNLRSPTYLQGLPPLRSSCSRHKGRKKISGTRRMLRAHPRNSRVKSRRKLGLGCCQRKVESMSGSLRVRRGMTLCTPQASWGTAK